MIKLEDFMTIFLLSLISNSVFILLGFDMIQCLTYSTVLSLIYVTIKRRS